MSRRFSFVSSRSLGIAGLYRRLALRHARLARFRPGGPSRRPCGWAN